MGARRLALMCALCCGLCGFENSWLGAEHPDWTDEPVLQSRNGEHLAIVAPLLDAYLRTPPHASSIHPPALAHAPVGVYWDFLSVYHDARGSMLSNAQRQLHTRGLAAAHHLYAHHDVAVWLQSRLSLHSETHAHTGAHQAAATATTSRQ